MSRHSTNRHANIQKNMYIQEPFIFDAINGRGSRVPPPFGGSMYFNGDIRLDPPFLSYVAMKPALNV